MLHLGDLRAEGFNLGRRGRDDGGHGVAGDEFHAEGVLHGAAEDVVDHLDAFGFLAVAKELGLQVLDLAGGEFGDFDVAQVGNDVFVDVALVTVNGFLATVGNDDVGHPLVQPFGELVASLRGSDAAVEFGEDFAESALGVGLFAADGFVSANDFALVVTAEKDADLPGAGAALFD